LPSYNILFVTESYTAHDRRFLKAAVKQGLNIWFSCINPPGKSVELPKSVNLWPGIHKPLNEWHELLLEFEIHVIHAGPCSSVLPLVVDNDFQCAVIGMSWSSDILYDIEFDDGLKELVVNTLKKTQSLIVDCEAVIDKISVLLPDKEFNFFKFPWGIDLDNYRRLPKKQCRQLREVLQWTDNTVLISTRTWDKIYGIPNLVEALNHLVDINSDVRLILIGDGPHRTQIMDKISKHKLAEYIHMPGRISEEKLNVWYGVADIYVSSSLSDGSSVSLLEAMASGLPVVVNNRHGNKEWVKHNESGWLTDCSSVNAMFTTLKSAINSRKDWKRIGTENRNKVLDYADWRKNLHALKDAYEITYNEYLIQNNRAR
jgi:L-malate glycosyltransferase